VITGYRATEAPAAGGASTAKGARATEGRIEGTPARGPTAESSRSEAEGRDVWLRGIADLSHIAPHIGRPRRRPLVGTVIHATRGGGIAGALAEVKKGAKTWHFTVDRTGDVYQHVALNRTAGHAGTAEFPTPDGRVTAFVSEQTIGIELANLGALVKSTDGRGRPAWRVWIPPKDGKPASESSFTVKATDPVPGTIRVGEETIRVWWERFPDAQINALIRVLSAFREVGYGAALNELRGHQQVARPRGRKIDPGQAFPWARVRAALLP
jgi:N-acetylmuramoyl-L-alanine amidase